MSIFSNITDRRIAANTIWLYGRMVAIMLINMLAVRFVRSDYGLGVESYGVFNAIMGVVNIFVCMNTVLANAAQRFFSIKLGEQDADGLHNVFRVSVRISIYSAAVAFLLFETVGLWFVIEKMSYPAELFDEVMVIYQTSIITFITLLVQVPFVAAVLTHEKMNVFSLITLFTTVLNLGLAFTLRYCPTHRLLIYGIGYMCTTIISMTLFIVYAKRHFPESLRKSLHFDSVRTMYKDVLSFSGWTMLGSIAGVVLLQGTMLLYNTYFGPIANAAFAIAMQIYGAFGTLGNNILLAIRPQMIQCYAKRDYHQTRRYFWLSTAALIILLTIVAVPIEICMPKLLHLWLGTVDELTIIMSRLIIMVQIILLIGNPITIIMEAAGRVKEYHLPVEISILLCVPISWILLSHGANIESPLWVMIGMTIIAHLIRCIVLARYAYKNE
ncbi:MAG: MATE family efflux transporter [Paludibacteraceae bacterium]|nr:MATE family efflux transporter [Paludibacteraceae bacterium]